MTVDDRVLTDIPSQQIERVDASSFLHFPDIHSTPKTSQINEKHMNIEELAATVYS